MGMGPPVCVDVNTADLALMLAIHDEDPLLIEHAKRRYAQAFDITISLTHDGDLWRCQVNGGEQTVGISPLPVLRMAVRDHVATLPIRRA